MNFNKEIQKTKLWDEFPDWYRDYLRKENAPQLIMSDQPSIDWFLSLQWEFTEGVYRKFLMEKEYIEIYTCLTQGKYCGFAVTKLNKGISKLIEASDNKTDQKAMQAIILKCFNTDE